MANILNIKIKSRKNNTSKQKRNNGKETFEVRDLREFAFFTVDNAFLDGKWLRVLKGCPAAVYFALCRHADKQQQSFPAVQYLCDETGYGKRQVTRAIKKLEFHCLVSVDRQMGGNNIYSLLNRKHWKKTKIVFGHGAICQGPVHAPKGLKPMKRFR
jgi:hypothetical protein